MYSINKKACLLYLFVGNSWREKQEKHFVFPPLKYNRGKTAKLYKTTESIFRAFQDGLILISAGCNVVFHGHPQSLEGTPDPLLLLRRLSQRIQHSPEVWTKVRPMEAGSVVLLVEESTKGHTLWIKRQSWGGIAIKRGSLLTISIGEPNTPNGIFMLPTLRVPYIKPGLKIIPAQHSPKLQMLKTDFREKSIL